MNSKQLRMFGPSSAPLVNPSWLEGFHHMFHHRPPHAPAEVEREFTQLELLLLASVSPDWLTKVKDIFTKDGVKEVAINLDPEFNDEVWNGEFNMQSFRNILWALSVLELDIELRVNLGNRVLPASTMALLFTVVHNTKDVSLRGCREEVTLQLFHTWTTDSKLKILSLGGVSGLKILDQKHLVTRLCSLEEFSIRNSPINIANLVSTVVTLTSTSSTTTTTSTSSSSTFNTATKTKLQTVNLAYCDGGGFEVLGMEEVETEDLVRFVTSMLRFRTHRSMVTAAQWAALFSFPGGGCYDGIYWYDGFSGV